MFITIGLFIAGCTNLASQQGVPLDSIHVELPQPGSNKRIITARLDDGTQLVGSYSTLSDKLVAMNETFAEAQGASRYAWASAQGFLLKSEGENGSLVIDCVYAVVSVPGLGHGRCMDNKGKIYTLRF